RAGTGPERADRPGRVEAGVVVAGRDRLRHLRLHLDADEVGQKQRRPVRAVLLGQRKGGRQHRRGRVGQQPVHPVRQHGQLGVVVVVGVDAYPVEEGGEAGRQPGRGAAAAEPLRYAPTWRRPTLATSVREPATARPSPSRIERFAAAATSPGTSPGPAPTMNWLTSPVTLSVTETPLRSGRRLARER